MGGGGKPVYKKGVQVLEIQKIERGDVSMKGRLQVLEIKKIDGERCL